MSSDYLKLVRDGELEKENGNESREREKGDVIAWRATSVDYPYIFEIKVEENITIILIDTCTECVFIVHNPTYDDLFVKRFRDIPHLLSYLETHCSDSGKYVFKISDNRCSVYVHRRDLIDTLVRCMAKMLHYAKPFYSKD
jgi:hypothetical protein